jgi:hypothetical protein
MSDDHGLVTRHRDLIRAGLIALALPTAAIGAWALLAPHGWYSDFPWSGRHWVSALGPYDEHLVRDFGSLYLGLGFLLLLAAVTLVRLLVQAALGAYLIFAVPHFVFHATETGSLGTGDNVANIVTLALGLAIAIALLAATFRTTTGTAPTRDKPIEGGITYGTR